MEWSGAAIISLPTLIAGFWYAILHQLTCTAFIKANLFPQQVFFVKFSSSKYKNMWDRGNFGSSIVNHSALFDPWSQTGKKNTPFDQAFYLILNVAVGGTNGFFKDGVSNKPWADASPTATKAFWDSQQLWYPSWGKGADRGLSVKSVKMWSEGACGAK